MKTTQSEEKDALFNEAAIIVVCEKQGSVSLIQRRLRLGYFRAGRIIDQLEKAGIVGAFNGSAPRSVMVSDLQELKQKFNIS